MIWLAWRRARLSLCVGIGGLVVLGAWLAFARHEFEVAFQATTLLHGHRVPDFDLSIGPFGNGLFEVENQASAIHAALLCLPCFLGVVLGAPLVAGELTGLTNRLSWTQDVSRTRWFATRWWVTVLVPLALVAALIPLTYWWSLHALGRFALASHDGGLGRMSPLYFPFTGVVPVAYTAFAFALGVALGALTRRTSLAMVGTVAAYAVVALFMATTIRPELAPQVFTSGDVPTSGPHLNDVAWDLGPGFRLMPGHHAATGSQSPSVIGTDCLQEEDPAVCLTNHGIEFGELYQPADHYWALQWRESAIYLGLTALLFGVGLWSVRRWRA